MDIMITEHRDMKDFCIFYTFTLKRNSKIIHTSKRYDSFKKIKNFLDLNYSEYMKL